LSAFGATGFLAAAMFPTLPVFIAGTLTGLVCVTALIPLLTQMYQDNYLPDRRGRLFSNTIMIRIVAAAVFSWAAGQVLAHDLSLFRWLLVVFAGALLASSFCLGRCPSKPLARGTKSGLFSGLAHVRDDDVFRRTLISWMLMGFANLVIFQLRVEYMANPIYGEPISRYEIALLTGVIPNLARLVMSPVWGRLFDKMNFFTLRITLNMGFAIGALAFFAGRGVAGLVFGAIVLGIALAGGDVAWSLWVTKLAKPERVAEYMSVHTFLNGVRGVAAPVIGYYMLTQVSFHALSMMCAGLIGIASLMLVPEIKAYRDARLARAATAQASD
jgi:MFS family permease